MFYNEKGCKIEKFEGVLSLLYDSIPGENKDRQGLVYVATIQDVHGDDYNFVIREMKNYISKVLPCDQLLMEFGLTKSPKYGDCFLLNKYGDSKKGVYYTEPGRRILIHHGTSEVWSENCLIMLDKNASVDHFRSYYDEHGSLRGYSSKELSKALLKQFSDAVFKNSSSDVRNFQVTFHYEGGIKV